jgi:hypothetical protein
MDRLLVDDTNDCLRILEEARLKARDDELYSW